MATSMERFTAWLSAVERDEIRKQARALGASENYVLRMIIREHYRLVVPTEPTDKPERV